MTKTLHTALMAATALPESSGAPEWIHLLPAADAPVTTRDGRGPYRIASLQSVLADSLADFDRLPLDENHATDIAAPQGQSAPARGWITALEARANGIWGRVEWTPAGRELIETHAYRYISPVIGHSADGTIRRILRASLVNKPNLRGLTALHQEGAMTLLERLAELLGLPAEASEAEVVEAVTGIKAEKGGDSAALQSQMAEISTALGVAGGDHASILTAARKAVAGGADTITALQSELASVTTRLNTLTETSLRDKAAGFIDTEIRKGRVGLKPLRDHYISRHMSDAASVEKEVAALPLMAGATTSAAPPEEFSTHADTGALVTRATAYQKKLARVGQNITYAAAVRAVQDGKDK